MTARCHGSGRTLVAPSSGRSSTVAMENGSTPSRRRAPDVAASLRHVTYCLWSLVVVLAASTAHAAPPHLEKQGTAMHLIVKGKPMLVLGGELGNSSASSAAYMAPHWPRLKQMNLNTVLAPVSWELIEPVEGEFTWDSLDQLLKDARAHDLKLVVLWFGAWKTACPRTFPRG